jgi:hypothetical protein
VTVVDRRAKQLLQSLLIGKPLEPRRERWTLGDLLALSRVCEHLLGGLDDVPPDPFRVPLLQFKQPA